MVVVLGFYEVGKKNLAGVSRAKDVSTALVYMLVNSAPQAATQVQPQDVLGSREVMKSPSGLLDKDKSQLGKGGESTPDKDVLASVQIPGLTSLSPIAQGEFLENQILEIDRGLSCFDTNDGDVSTSDGLAVVVPFG